MSPVMVTSLPLGPAPWAKQVVASSKTAIITSAAFFILSISF
jgi:hypothetical protein